VLETQLIRVPFVAGLDTKSDSKAVEPPFLVTLSNGVLTSRGVIRKRYGYTQLGTSVYLAEATSAFDMGAFSLQTLLSRGDELLALGRSGTNVGGLYSYDIGQSEWYHKGTHIPVTVTHRSVPKRNVNQNHADYAEASGVGITAYEDSAGGLRLSVVDTVTGSAIYSQYQIASYSRPKLIALSGSIFLFGVTGTTLAVKKITPSDVAGTIGSAFTNIATNLAATPNYDVCATSSNMVAVYDTSTANTLGLRTISTALVVSAQTPLTAAGAPTCCGIMPSFDGSNVGVVWASAAAVERVVYTNALSPLGLVTTVEAAPGTVNQITCYFGTSTSTPVTVYEKNAASARNREVWSNGALLVTHSALIAKPLDATLGTSSASILVQHESTLQATAFLLNTGKVTPENAPRWIARLFPGNAGSLPTKAHLPSISLVSGSKYAVAVGYKERLDVLPTSTTEPAVYAERGIKTVYLDLDSAAKNAATQVGGAAYFGGGFLWQYDGRWLVEQGFHLYPEIDTSVHAVTKSAVGGTRLTTTATYWYRVYYEWTNAAGERERSTTGAAIPVTLAGAEDTVQLTIPTLAHTLKRTGAVHTGGPGSEVSIAIYRTAANPTADFSFHRVSSLDPTTAGTTNGWLNNNAAVSTVTFDDGMPDTTLVSKEIDYLSTGELDNVAPPACSVVATGRNRTFVAGLDDPNLIWASKLRFHGEPLSFSDAITIQVDETGGPITGMAVTGDHLVIFKESRIYVVGGDGPDNGGNGTFSEPLLLSADIGCSNARSIAHTTAGVMFAASNQRGIWLLDKSYSLKYIGAPVESYNSQTITSAKVIPGASQVRFLVSSGSTLVYDFENNQWSTFSITGLSAVVCNDAYHYLASASAVRQESSSVFTDNGTGYQLVIKTAWIKLGGLAGFQRVKRAHIVGECMSSTTLRATLYFDYSASGSTKDLAWTNGVIRERIHMPTQKCSAVQFQFEDVSPTAESYRISELLLEIGLKRGAQKLPSASSI